MAFLYAPAQAACLCFTVQFRAINVIPWCSVLLRSFKLRAGAMLRNLKFICCSTLKDQLRSTERTFYTGRMESACCNF